MKRNFTISIPWKKLWLVVLPITIAVIIVGGIVGVIVVDRIVMPNLPGLNNRGIVKVPNILKIEKESAKQKLYDYGLRLRVQKTEYNDTIPAGIVLLQQPKAGTKVKKGRHIFVIISDGPEVATLPEIRQLSERQAKRLLRKTGFKDIRVLKKYSNKVNKDLVCGMDPSVGIETSREVPITIVVSKGPKPTHTQVPNLVGDLLSDAKRKIENANLKVGTITYKMTSGSTVGRVMSQSISPGKNIELETKINIVVSASKK